MATCAEKESQCGEVVPKFCLYGIALHVLVLIVSILVAAKPKRWKDRLKSLTKVDWARSNTKPWEGRAMAGGSVSKAHNNVVLTVVILKRALQVSPCFV